MRIVNKEVTGILAIAIMLTIVTPVFAAATVYHDAWTEDLTGWSWLSTCTEPNEWVVIVKGTAQYRLDIVVDSTGVVHYTFFGRHNLLGVGQNSGEVYQTISVFSQHWHNTQGFPSEWTFVNTSPSISHGGLVNGMYTIRNHVTVNANGEVTVSYSEVEVTCHG
jgi:hypothetical protein